MLSVKKLVYMTEDQERLLREAARRENISEAEVMRRALEAYVRGRLQDPFRELIGMANDGPVDGAEKHDRYIYGERP